MAAEKLSYELSESSTESVHVYRLTGPMVLGNMFAFQEVLRSESVATILDMTNVPYIDSAGLGVLTNAFVSHQKQGNRLLLVAVNERVRALFELTKLDQLFAVFSNVEDALKAAS
jgi:anti-anti-sigma factor